MKGVLLLVFLFLSLATVLVLHAAERRHSPVTTRNSDPSAAICGQEVDILPSLIIF